MKNLLQPSHPSPTTKTAATHPSHPIGCRPLPTSAQHTHCPATAHHMNTRPVERHWYPLRRAPTRRVEKSKTASTLSLAEVGPIQTRFRGGGVARAKSVRWAKFRTREEVLAAGNSDGVFYALVSKCYRACMRGSRVSRNFRI